MGADEICLYMYNYITSNLVGMLDLNGNVYF